MGGQEQALFFSMALSNVGVGSWDEASTPRFDHWVVVLSVYLRGMEFGAVLQTLQTIMVSVGITFSNAHSVYARTFLS